jgi:hypothetical protein
MIGVAFELDIGPWTLTVRRFLRLPLGVGRWALGVRRFLS